MNGINVASIEYVVYNYISQCSSQQVEAQAGEVGNGWERATVGVITVYF